MVTQAQIEAVEWRKTTYIEPHEYILVTDHPELVEEITKCVKEEGIIKEFRGAKYRYFYFNGYRYWRMGVVLNRCRAKQ